MIIILLRGFSHSGKDFIGEILCKKYGYTRFAFADSLKNIVANKYNCTLEQLHSQEGKLQLCKNDSNNRTYRQILIDEALRLRSIDTGVFAKICCNDIINSGLNKIVITDWRYDNELEIINSVFSTIKVVPVHIVRIGQNISPVVDISEYQLQHRNEDYIIYNNMNDKIYDQINELIRFIGD